jgi:hypothetical protein
MPPFVSLPEYGVERARLGSRRSNRGRRRDLSADHLHDLHADAFGRSENRKGARGCSTLAQGEHRSRAFKKITRTG